MHRRTSQVVAYLQLLSLSLVVSIGLAQSTANDLLAATSPSMVNPGDVLAGPAPLQGSSALGICLIPTPNPWNAAAVIVVDLFQTESWIYDALTLEPITSIPHPAPGSTTTGITTNGTSLYWGVLAPPGPSQLWRTNLDGSNPALLGEIGLQVTGFVGGLAWDGADGIWAVDIAGDRYDLISINNGSYLGTSILHPDTDGAGNGIAFRGDCDQLEVPHGSNFAGRVTTISTIDPLTDIPLGPLEVANLGFFINGIETSRPGVAPTADPFGVYSIWIVDNSSNTFSAIEGRSICPQPLDPINGLLCNSLPDGQIEVSWDPDPSLDSVEIRIDGMLVAIEPADSGFWSGSSTFLPDFIQLEICARNAQQWTPTRSCELITPGCPESSLNLSHLNDSDTIDQGVPLCSNGAGHSAQSFWRTYDLCQSPFNLTNGLELEAVQISIDESDPNPGSSSLPVTLRLYEDPDGGSINPISSLQILHQQQFQIPAINRQQLCLNLTPALDIDCDTKLVVELALPDSSLEGHLLILGSNSSGETAEGWWSAPFCGIDQPTPLSNLGFFDQHIGIDLMGNPAGNLFIRGDTNGDSARNLTDAIRLLQTLFVPGTAPLSCIDSGDTNDDGGMNLADAVYLLSFLFIPGSPSPPPPEFCGTDSTPSDPLDCDIFAGCP